MGADSATATFSGPMNVPQPARASRDPGSAGATPVGRAVAGLAVRAHDDVLRGVRARAAARYLARPRLCRHTGARKVRLQLFRHECLEPGQKRIRSARADLRNAGDVGHRVADRRAGELRHRAVSDRDVPGSAEAAARYGGRAAGGHSVDHLRHVGPVRVRAAVRRLRAAAAAKDLRQPLDPGSLVQRRSERHRHAFGGHHSLGDGDPLYFVGDARRVRDRPAGAEGVRVRHRLHDLGSGAQRRAPLHQGRRHRRHHAGPGPRARRDHGGDLHHRQCLPHQQLAVRARQLHRVGARQRIQRGGGPGPSRVADHARPGVVRADLDRACIVAPAHRAAGQG